LEEVRLNLSESYRKTIKTCGDSSMQACKAAFIAYLELHADVFKDRKIPRVVVGDIER